MLPGFPTPAVQRSLGVFLWARGVMVSPALEAAWAAFRLSGLLTGPSSFRFPNSAFSSRSRCT